MDEFSEYLLGLQARIVEALEEIEGPAGKRFSVVKWGGPRNGSEASGRAAVIQGGKVFEKGGVNYSRVIGLPASRELMEAMLEKIPGNVDPGGKYTLDVSGISLIMHPLNPYCPTVHMNYRHFKVNEGERTVEEWFGGGCDLTPYYLFPDDVAEFHGRLKEVCDAYGVGLYEKLKDMCDRYFYIEHRKEHRGVGGIFFDYVRETGEYDVAGFAKSCGESFLGAYLPIIGRRKDLPYGPREELWQRIRRSRYAEFNLVRLREK